jgi:hypothetical protein
MKKIIRLSVVAFVLVAMGSCTKTDPPVPVVLTPTILPLTVENLKGKYVMNSATLKTAIDLNNDNILGTNLFDKKDYVCQTDNSFEFTADSSNIIIEKGTICGSFFPLDTVIRNLKYSIKDSILTLYTPSGSPAYFYNDFKIETYNGVTTVSFEEFDYNLEQKVLKKYKKIN